MKSLKFFLLLLFSYLLIGINSNLSSQVVDFTKIYKICVQGTVFIEIPGIGYGSGFQISEDGFIITNHHVIDGVSQNPIVYFSDGQSYYATVVASNKSVDLALLKIADNNHGVLPILLQDGDVPIGSAVMAIGASNLDNPFSQQSGSVNNLGRDQYIHHNASITYGFSGGPLIDSDGYVIGVNCGGITSTDKERNFAIKASYLWAFLSSLTTNNSSSTNTTSNSRSRTQSVSGGSSITSNSSSGRSSSSSSAVSGGNINSGHVSINTGNSISYNRGNTSSGSGRSSSNSSNYGTTTYEGYLVGNYGFDRNYIVEGDVTGNITIQPGIKVVVEGDVHGNVIIQKGGRLKVEGDLVGNVTLWDDSQINIEDDLIGNLSIYPGSKYSIEGDHVGNVRSR